MYEDAQNMFWQPIYQAGTQLMMPQAFGVMLMPVLAMPMVFQPLSLTYNPFSMGNYGQTLPFMMGDKNYCSCSSQAQVEGVEKIQEGKYQQELDVQSIPAQNKTTKVLFGHPNKPTDENEEDKGELSEEGSHYALRGWKYSAIYEGEGKKRRKLYQCMYEDCGRIFTKTWNFKDHANIHKGIKPYVCEVCSKSFTQKGNKIKHMKQHDIEDVDARRTYKCTICPKRYTEKYNLKVRIGLLFVGVPPESFLVP